MWVNASVLFTVHRCIDLHLSHICSIQSTVVLPSYSPLPSAHKDCSFNLRTYIYSHATVSQAELEQEKKKFSSKNKQAPVLTSREQSFHCVLKTDRAPNVRLRVVNGCWNKAGHMGWWYAAVNQGAASRGGWISFRRHLVFHLGEAYSEFSTTPDIDLSCTSGR